MKRYAEQSITLSDGTVIPRGSQVVVSTAKMWDPSIYPNPLEFQSDRFLKLRQNPEKESTARLSSATIDHMGFSYGRHVCPGRHYATALMKLVLCHILIKYDMKLVGKKPASLIQGWTIVPDPTAEIEVRRRQEEIRF